MQQKSIKHTNHQKDNVLKFINNILELLHENYIYPNKFESLENHIKEKISEYEKKAKSEIIDMLSDDIQLILKDKHIAFFPSKSPKKEQMKQEDYIKFLQTKWMKSKIIGHNIGYIQFNDFPPFVEDFQINVLAPIIMDAYEKVKNCDKIIFDLRKNHGGHPSLIQFMQSFLFREKVLLNELYWRNKGTNIHKIDKFYTYTKTELEELIKSNYLPLLYDKQIIVLVSRNTFSAAEEFAYNLQTRKRAIIVGENSAGGANPGTMFKINTKTVIFVPTGRAYNPVSKTNWDGVGVIPDVQINNSLSMKEIIKYI